MKTPLIEANADGQTTGLAVSPCSAGLVPGRGWKRLPGPYGAPSGVWEDAAGNRCTPVTGQEWIYVRPLGGPTRYITYDDPVLKAARRRNGNIRRAGLAAAARIFQQNTNLEPRRE